MNNSLSELYQYAELHNIDVISIMTRKAECLSIMDMCGNCGIGINPFCLSSTADEKVKLAHELGHCETGAFYNMYSSVDIREKHERKADKWAIKKLVPKNELVKAYKSGIYDNAELAEFFGITEEFLQKVLNYYTNEII